MTMVAGVFAQDSQRIVPPEVTSGLAAAMSRRSSDQAVAFSGPGYSIAFLDLRLLPGSGVVTDGNGGRSFLCGDPLLTARDERTRDDDLQVLHVALLRDDPSPLARCRGSFSLVHVNPATETLHLAVDKLGLRPLYLAINDGFIYFASTLRTLEGLTQLPKRLGVRGLAEASAFGYPLGTRTQYEGIELLDAGEHVVLKRSTGLSRRHYWRWDTLERIDMDPAACSRTLHTLFQEAVRVRLDRDRNTVCLFSGGLDSRCTVAALKAEGRQVHSINLAPEGTLDLALGRVAAQALGTHHFEKPHGSGNIVERAATAHEEWLASVAPGDRPQFPAAIWTGAGGSVGMGHIYLTDEMIGLMRRGQRAAAVQAYLRENRIALSPSVFQREFRDTVQTCCVNGVLEQLERLDSFDEGRRLHLFLLTNGQRRLMADALEDIDRVRLEYVSPFFDFELLRFIVACPIDAFLAHRLYNRWLGEFPFHIDAFPWQAYRGHEACPLPLPAGLRDQWQEGWHSAEEVAAFSASDLRRTMQALTSRHFPAHMLRKGPLWLAWLLTRSGLRDYSYLLKVARVFTERAEHTA